MEFAEKYELLESLTTGAVETFVSNDKLRGCRVLVHILHCEPQRPNQPTVQWVLEGFRKVAPEPAGTVLEAGRYSGTLYAYVVTKLPEDDALRDWVRRYNAQLADTQESTSVMGKVAVSHDSTTDDLLAVPTPPLAAPPKETSNIPVQFTQMFRNFDLQAKPSPAPQAKEDVSTTSMPSFGSPEPPIGRPAAPWDAPPPLSQPRSMPSFGDPQNSSALRPAPPEQPAASLNQEAPRSSFPHFDDPDRPSGFQAAPPWDPGTSLNPIPARKDQPKPDFSRTGLSGTSFTAEFGIRSLPSSESKPPLSDGSKAGEFTSFFQGPFRPDTPAELPPLPSRPVETPGKQGEFTAMFRPSSSSSPSPIEPPLPPMGSTGLPGTSGPGTGLTGWYTDADIMSRTPDNAAPPPAAQAPPASKEPILPLPKVSPAPLPPPPPPVMATPPVFPLPTPKPVAPKPPAMSPAPPSPSGATGAFRPMGSVSEPEPLEPEPQAGPSPYTQIISVRSRSVDPEAGEDAPAGSKAGGFGLPKIEPPKMDKMAPPPMPKFTPPKAPAPPKGMALPKAPKVDVPKAPKVDLSKPDAPAPPPVSFWPLVITLTVLVFLAVILVLYFVLKH